LINQQLSLSLALLAHKLKIVKNQAMTRSIQDSYGYPSLLNECYLLFLDVSGQFG